MRTLNHWLAAGLSLAVLGCQGSGGSDGDNGSGSDGPEGDGGAAAAFDSSIPHRTFKFTYAVTVPATDGTKQLRVWVPLPRDEAGVQKVADLQVTAPDGWRQTESADYGNRWVYCEVANPNGPTQIEWSAVVTRYEDRGQGTGTVHDGDTQENLLIPINSDATARDQADKIVEKLGLTAAGLSDDDKAQRIYNDVLDNMKYDKSGTGWGRGDFLHAVTVCEGNCTDFHARFIGVGRRVGLPVRFTMGIPMKTDAEGTYNSYHCWAHWYDAKSKTWKPVDISEADKVVDTDPARAKWFYGHLNEDRITLTYGRDLALEPRQNGALLNYAVFPHAEADGEPVKMGKSDWVFTYANVK